MIKRLIIVLLIVGFGKLCFSQAGSPYSQFGVGDISNRGFGYSQSMGGIGIGLRTNQHINYANPAAYTELDSMSVIYELGVSGMINHIESNNSSLDVTDATFDHLAMGFKMGKNWFASIGLVPLSKIDYTFKTNTLDSVIGYYDTYYHGNGGLNQLYFGNAFKFGNFSYGLNIAYTFGSLNKVNGVHFLSDVKSLSTKYDSKVFVSDCFFTNGIQYTFKINKSKNLTLGAVYETNLSQLFQGSNRQNAKYDEMAGTIVTSSIDETFYKDLYFGELKDTIYLNENQKTNVLIPTLYGFGATYAHTDKFLAGLEFNVQNYSETKSIYFTENFKNFVSARGGLEFTPDKNNINYYYKRMHYRFGGYYSKTHLELKTERINDYGITFGVGLPLGNSKTTFNITGKVGQRGTLDQNLLRETYGVISLNLSLSDIWFVKRKFN